MLPGGKAPERGDDLRQACFVGPGEGDGFGAAEPGVVDAAGEGGSVGAGDAAPFEEPEVEAELPAVGVFDGAAFLGLVEDAVAEVRPVDPPDQQGAAGGFGFEVELFAAAGLARFVDEAAQGDGLALLLHPQAPHGEPGFPRADGVVPDEHPADADGRACVGHEKERIVTRV